MAEIQHSFRFRSFSKTQHITHIRIGSILPPRFFQYLYMSFVDMQISLIQKFLPETMNDVLEPIPVDDQKPV